MGVRGTNEMCPHLTGKIDVFDKSAASGEETKILNPARGLTDEGHGAALAPRTRRPDNDPVAAPFRLTIAPETMVASYPSAR